MTERHPDDEALSAVLDGEGDAADHDHVEGCRVCQARVNELRVVSYAVGAPIAARPEPEISAAVSRALADAPLVATRRVARRAPAPPPSRWSPKGARILAIAAAVVVVAGVASIMAATSNHGTPHNSAASAKSATTAAAPPASAAAAGAASAAAPATSPSTQAALSTAPPPDLGDQSDPAALAATLRSLEQQNRAGSAATILSPPTCASTAATGAGLEADARAVVALPLRWHGQDAQVLVFVRSTGAGGQTAVVVDTASCAVLTSFAM